jgi:hypothetical protein
VRRSRPFLFANLPAQAAAFELKVMRITIDAVHRARL